jgi:hypothetical protein
MGKRGTIPELLILIASVSILFGLGCSGSHGDSGVITPTLGASFLPSNTPAASNLIRLRGGTSADDVVNVEVVVGGPTSSSDLYGFAFDLVIADTTVVGFERATAGTALTVTGSQSRNVQASLVGNHLIVGVTKLGGGAGNVIGAGEAVVVTLTLKVLKAGTSSVTFAGATAVSGCAGFDSAGQVVPSIQFDPETVSVTGQ